MNHEIKEVGFAYPRNVQEASERIKPSYLRAQTVTVEFHPEEGVIRDYVRVEFQAISIAASKENVTLTFDEEEFAAYCNSFLVSRVNWVNGEKYIIHPNDHLACPALLDAILKNIGLVLETTQGLTLVPAIAECATLSVDRMREISFILDSIETYIGGSGYVSDKSGSWEFMSMQLVEGVIMSEANVHPAYSTLAAVVGPQWIGALTSPRIKYGDLSLYKALLWQLTSVKLA